MLADGFGFEDGGDERDDGKRHDDRANHDSPARLEEFEEFDRRLAAVERALTDSGSGSVEVHDTAPRHTADSQHSDLADSVDELEAAVGELEARVDELDAAMQAIRGYAGGIRAVNRDVERRADLALAKVEALVDEPATDAEIRAIVDAGGDERSEPTGTGGSGSVGADESEPTETGEPTPTETDESDPSLADRFRAVP